MKSELRGGCAAGAGTRRRRRYAWLGAVAAVSAALAIATASALGATAAPSAAGATRGETLTMWAPPGEFSTPGFNNLVKAYEKESGNKIKITVVPLPFEQTVLAKFATGVRPDLLIFHAIGNWMLSLNPSQTLLPLDGMSFIKKTLPGILPHSSTYKGHVYAAILGFPIIDGMFYNRDVFKKAGVAIPTNYSQIQHACQVIKSKEPGVAPIYVAANGTDDWTDQILPFELWNDALKKNPSIIPNINTNKDSFASKPFVSAFAALQRLEKAGCVNSDILSGTYVKQQQAIVTGKAAMVFQLTSFIPALVTTYGKARVDKEVGFTCISQTTNVCSWQATASSENVFVPKTGNTSKENVAKDFIKYATTTGYAKFVHESQTYPLLKGYTKNVDTAAIPVPEQQAYAQFVKNRIPQYQQDLLANYGPIQDNLQAMLAGKLSPQDVGNKMAQDFKTAAKQEGLPGF